MPRGMRGLHVGRLDHGFKRTTDRHRPVKKFNIGRSLGASPTHKASATDHPIRSKTRGPPLCSDEAPSNGCKTRAYHAQVDHAPIHGLDDGLQRVVRKQAPFAFPQRLVAMPSGSTPRFPC